MHAHMLHTVWEMWFWQDAQKETIIRGYYDYIGQSFLFYHCWTSSNNPHNSAMLFFKMQKHVLCEWQLRCLIRMQKSRHPYMFLNSLSHYLIFCTFDITKSEQNSSELQKILKQFWKKNIDNWNRKHKHVRQTQQQFICGKKMRWLITQSYTSIF